MKSIRLFIAAVSILLVSLGCGLGTLGQPDAEPAPTENVSSENNNETYPIPEAAYPAAYPSVEGGDQTSGLPDQLIYPELKDGDTLEWDQVPGAMFSGLVTEVMQTHDLKVYLTFKDGRTLMATEPMIDAILDIVKNCGEICSEVRVATE